MSLPAARNLASARNLALTPGYLMEFPLYFPFFFPPERILAPVR